VRVNRSLAFSLGLLVASVLGLGWALQRDGADAPRAEVAKLSRWIGVREPEPVLVVVLGAEGSVRGVRAVIPADRIVAETATAFDKLRLLTSSRVGIRRHFCCRSSSKESGRPLDSEPKTRTSPTPYSASK
jgi:hypothetical protein